MVGELFQYELAWGIPIVGYEPYAERIRSQTEPGSHVAMAAEERESIQFFTHYLVTDRYVDWDHARISTLDYSDQSLKDEVLEDISGEWGASYSNFLLKYKADDFEMI